METLFNDNCMGRRCECRKNAKKEARTLKVERVEGRSNEESNEDDATREENERRIRFPKKYGRENDGKWERK